MNRTTSTTVSNIYQLEGRVPLIKAIPFGLQHILAMFVANLTPITIIAAAGGLSQAETAILLLGTLTLAVCLLWNIFSKGYLKQLSVLAGLLVGYIVAIFMGKVDLSLILSGGIVSLPKFLPYAPEFHLGAIFSVCIIFLVSAAETIGDTSAMAAGGLGREIESKEIPALWPATAIPPAFLLCWAARLSHLSPRTLA